MGSRIITMNVADRDPTIYAQTVRRVRLERGWSLTHLAKASGVSRITLAKIEKGQGCSASVELKVAMGLSAVPAALWMPYPEPKAYEFKLLANNRWHFGNEIYCEKYLLSHNLLNEENAFRFDPDGIQDDKERFRLGVNGLVDFFRRPYTMQLIGGNVYSSQLEIYSAMPYTPKEAGSIAYLFCIEGSLRIIVEGKETILSKDEAFYVSDLCRYEVIPIISTRRPAPVRALHTLIEAAIT